MKWDSDRGLKLIQIVVIALVLVLGVWQLARVGFDWKAVLATSDPWLFFVAMASLPVFGFPISACYIYAGLVFPPEIGILLCLGGLMVNMSLSYLLTQSFLKKPILRFLGKRRWRIPELSDENQFRFIFIVRTVPGLPFFFQNLALGLAGIPFWTYLWISLLTQGLIATGVILSSHYLSQDPWGAGGLTVILILTALFIGKSIQVIRKRRAGVS